MSSNPATKNSTATYLKIGVAFLMVAFFVGLFIYNARPGEPATSALGPGTEIGTVEIFVRDPQTVSAFYISGIGLTKLASDDTSITLGVDSRELLKLTRSDKPADNLTNAGLYHSAFLFPNQASLAGTLQRLTSSHASLYQGASDHAVSLAFYFNDPEGNGVELYVDRPAEQWKWNAQNHVTMGNAPLDINTFMSRNQSNPLMKQSGVTMGHIHLRVGDLDDAEKFYVDSLGFAVTAEAPGARFFSANGYHHHLGTNTWSSGGAGVKPDSQGLGAMTIHVANEAEINALESRLKSTAIDYKRTNATIRLTDPWGNTIVVSVAIKR